MFPIPKNLWEFSSFPTLKKGGIKMYFLALQLLKVLLISEKKKKKFYLRGRECLRSTSAYCWYSRYHTLQDALTLLERYKDPLLKADIHAIPKPSGLPGTKVGQKAFIFQSMSLIVLVQHISVPKCPILLTLLEFLSNLNCKLQLTAI